MWSTIGWIAVGLFALFVYSLISYCIGNQVVFAKAAKKKVPHKVIAYGALLTYFGGKYMAGKALKEKETECWFTHKIGRSYGFKDIEYDPWYD